MTKAADYRKWLAGRIWGNGCYGWSAPYSLSKMERATIDRWIKDGHVEQDNVGLLRLTAAGRKALDLPPV